MVVLVTLLKLMVEILLNNTLIPDFAMTHPIIIHKLKHNFGKHLVYDDLSMQFESGKIYGILGKNGVGKTTLIKILMGFLKPLSGECLIFGDPAYNISPETKSRVGLLFERHLTYDFFSIEQIERFTSRFYPKWNSKIFYDLVDRLHLPKTHIIANMSEGQRSQVVLGLMLAQDADLLILDDYSMGLDAGYRRLFIDYLKEYLKKGKRTVILTSHIIQDMQTFVDEAVFLERGGHILHLPMSDFMENFRQYRIPNTFSSYNIALSTIQEIKKDSIIKNMEIHDEYLDIFSFGSPEVVKEILQKHKVDIQELQPISMNLEDSFIGYTGRY